MKSSAYHISCEERRRAGKPLLPECTCVARMNGRDPLSTPSGTNREKYVWWIDCMGRYIHGVLPRGVQPHWTTNSRISPMFGDLVAARIARATPTMPPVPTNLAISTHNRTVSVSSFETNPYSDSPTSEATTRATSIYNSTSSDKEKGKTPVYGGGSSSGKGPYGEGSSSGALAKHSLHTQMSKVISNLRPILRSMRDHPGFNADHPDKSHPISIAHLVGTTEITIQLFDTMTKGDVNSGTAESLHELIDIICRCTRIAEAVIDENGNYQRLTQSKDRVAFGTKCVEDARKLMAAIDSQPQMRILKPKKLPV